MSDIRVKNKEGIWKDALGDKEGRQYMVDAPLLKTYSTTGAAAISKATTMIADYPGRDWKLKHISATFSSAPTTSESLTVTQTPGGIIPNRPSTVLFSVNPSLTAATSIVQIWEDGGLKMRAGDEVTLAFTNTDTRTIKAEIVVEVL